MCDFRYWTNCTFLEHCTRTYTLISCLLYTSRARNQRSKDVRKLLPLLDSSLSVVPLPRRHNPLIGLPNLTSLISSFGLRAVNIVASSKRNIKTYRHTPRADRVNVTLTLTTSTTVRMVSCIMLAPVPNYLTYYTPYRRS